MKKPAVVLVVFIFLSGCASHAGYGHNNAISTVKAHSAVANTPQINNYSGQHAHGSRHRNSPYVYRHTPYYQVNDTHDLVGLIFLMVFCVILNDGDC